MSTATKSPEQSCEKVFDRLRKLAEELKKHDHPEIHFNILHSAQYVDHRKVDVQFKAQARLVQADVAQEVISTLDSCNEHLKDCHILCMRMGEIVRMDNDTVMEGLSAKIRAPVKAIEVMKNIVTGTATIHRNVAEQFGINSVRYYRFNVDHGLEAVKLFDYKKTEDMEVDTLAYLDKIEVGKELKRCVEVMKVLPLREPSLLDNQNEEANVYSLGANGSPEEQRLMDRLNALRM